MKKTISWRRRYGRIFILLFCFVMALGVAAVLLSAYRPSENSLGALGSVCLDVISIAVLLILAIGLAFEKTAMNKTTKLFFGLMVATLLALFFDFMNWALDGSLEFGGWKNDFTMASLCMGPVLTGIFILYLSHYMDDMHNMKSQYLSARICVALSVVDFIITFSLAVTQKAYVFVDGHYETGELYDVVTVIPVLAVIYMAIYFVRYTKIIGFHDVVAVVGYIITMIAGALIEAKYSIGATYVSIALADIFIYVMLQNKLFDHVNRQKELLAQKVDEEKKNAEKWMHKSNTDELTGFYNRHAYEEEITALSKTPIKENFVYVSMDVNSLKVVNDTLGHEAGDELIVGAGNCMKQCFGAYGKIFRTGGDEFVALIYADEIQLKEIKQDIEEVTANWSGKLVKKLAVSCGYVSKKEAEGKNLHQIAVLADKKMYEDKTRYYQRKGIDRRGQRDAHVALCELYTKILKINITEDTYQVVNMREEERTAEKGFADNISQWLHDFGASGQVHPEDLEEYYKKTDINYLSDYFKSDNKVLHVFYRRKENDGYCKAMMEIIPANDYSDDSQNLFLYVKNID